MPLQFTFRIFFLFRGYYIRSKAIDHVLVGFLSQIRGKKQIISLGAGYDTSYFRLSNMGLMEDVKYFEV